MKLHFQLPSVTVKLFTLISLLLTSIAVSIFPPNENKIKFQRWSKQIPCSDEASWPTNLRYKVWFLLKRGVPSPIVIESSCHAIIQTPKPYLGNLVLSLSVLMFNTLAFQEQTSIIVIIIDWNGPLCFYFLWSETIICPLLRTAN